MFDMVVLHGQKIGYCTTKILFLLYNQKDFFEFIVPVVLFLLFDLCNKTDNLIRRSIQGFLQIQGYFKLQAKLILVGN